jgi:hypothetical protein
MPSMLKTYLPEESVDLTDDKKDEAKDFETKRALLNKIAPIVAFLGVIALSCVAMFLIVCYLETEVSKL